MTIRLCTALSHDRAPTALGELRVCEDHYRDIVDALTGPSAAADPTMDVIIGAAGYAAGCAVESRVRRWMRGSDG